jgi:hypothetical protein
MISAKNTDLVTKIFCAAWIAAGTALKAVGIVGLSIGEIIASGAGIAAIFCPVWISIWLDKIKQMRAALPEMGGK